MESNKHTKKEESLRKNLHDVRSHLAVILSASELAVLDEATIAREAALLVIKTTIAEVEAIMNILERLEK
jgi:hypothetical protein